MWLFISGKRDLAYELICNEQDADVLQIDDNDDNIENNNNYMEKDTCNEEIILSCGIYYSLFVTINKLWSYSFNKSVLYSWTSVYSYLKWLYIKIIVQSRTMNI